MRFLSFVTILISLHGHCLNVESEGTCFKDGGCERMLLPGLGLPGTESEWGVVGENMKKFLIQMKTSLRELGLAQLIGEMAEMGGLPGTKTDWMWLFTGVTIETVLDQWNEFIFNLKNGKFEILGQRRGFSGEGGIQIAFQIKEFHLLRCTLFLKPFLIQGLRSL